VGNIWSSGTHRCDLFDKMPKRGLKNNINILNVLILDFFKAPRSTMFRAESHRLLTIAVEFNMDFMFFLP